MTKYRITDTSHPRCGKKFRGFPTTEMTVVDSKTGDIFEQSQVEQVGDAHAAYIGFHIGRVGVFLFAREYVKYHTLQFGLAIDAVKYDDAYLDIELRIAVVGIGVRFVLREKTISTTY